MRKYLKVVATSIMAFLALALTGPPIGQQCDRKKVVSVYPMQSSFDLAIDGTSPPQTIQSFTVKTDADNIANYYFIENKFVHFDGLAPGGPTAIALASILIGSFNYGTSPPGILANNFYYNATAGQCDLLPTRLAHTPPPLATG